MGWGFTGSMNLPLEPYLIALCVAGLHAYTTIMDCSTDRKAGHRTFAILYGKRTAAILAFLTIVVALAFGMWLPSIVQYCWVCLVCYAIVIIVPSERLASILFKILAGGFMITALRVVVELA